ncbi:hypothetical protein BS47DRAFT_1343701 [Hydnum rufescens UP504]|uniref:Uncharacterized protein n=1 Tax=Hydnum rufescens UP504 TaxID=1448309 RepID=A0A9P6DWQ2_9AGAM|nr:hypothetical protein BS47DRAFT_1343701 [Hydnum rufescens UP504]
MNRTGSLYRARITLCALFKPTSRRIHLFPPRKFPETQRPNPGLHLDPALQQLLRDTDLSLIRSRKHREKLPRTYNPTELEGIPVSSEEDAEAWEAYELGPDIHDPGADVEAWHNRSEKLSQEAAFGSKRIGQISIPLELERSMAAVIQESDKHQLRSDAKRLFLQPSTRKSPRREDEWTTELPEKFKGSKKLKASRITPREALVFAVISMPAQYAAITNVLHETRNKLGKQWADQIHGFIDFGSGTGSGIWAALNEFRGSKTVVEADPGPSGSLSDPVTISSPHANENDGGPLANSTIKHYLCLENRFGMLKTSKRLTRDVSMGSTRIHVEKFWGQVGYQIDSAPGNTVAMLAFTLSELPNDTKRRMMLREMWNTGAETMVIIDNGSEEGFKIVADAREYLLSKGRKSLKLSEATTAQDTEDTNAVFNNLPGSHVVAPCPHDGRCPMTIKGSKKIFPDICHFSQRLSRPTFLRHTKHASKGHEDILYSYVVIRRGTRPAAPPSLWDPVVKPQLGTFPGKGKRVLREISREAAGSGDETSNTQIDLEWRHEPETLADQRRRDRHWISKAPPRPEEEIRAESFYWPRVIYPPLKRSGHVILDTCTKDGDIARHTIPRSQGKQPYYDARKSSWGDAFPWQSKNGPEIRRRGAATLGDSDEATMQDDDINESLIGDWDLVVGEDGLSLQKAS